MFNLYTRYKETTSKKLTKKIQLRSGRALPTVQFPDKFFRVIDEDINRWPNEQQAYKLSTKTLNKKKFEEHIRWLMTYMVYKQSDKTNREAKTNRMVLMATALSLINVSHDNFMRIHYRRLSEMVLKKFEEYDGPAVQEFKMSEFIDDFKKFVLV